MSEVDTMPWVEKYRPKNLSEISSQSNTTTILQRSIKSANLPHLLFYGPPGTGKTSTILALAHQLYGPKLIKSRVLELNASDERGISIVRDRIKNFARLTVSNPSDDDLKKYPCPPYKLIILDEADSMTPDAQSALRRTMETYANVTRFCLICNYVTRIIDPLASRCSKFRFKSLEESEGIKRLNYIAKMENIKVDEKISRDLINVCEGDLRRAINLLQCIGTVLKAVDGDDNDQKNSESVKELFGFLNDEKLSNLLQILMNHNFNNIINFIEDEILYQGYSASILLTSLHDKLLLSNEGLSLSLDNNQKNQISLLLFKTDSKLVNGGSDKIQLLNCLLHLSKIL